jgi:hypothetical protein
MAGYGCCGSPTWDVNLGRVAYRPPSFDVFENRACQNRRAHFMTKKLQKLSSPNRPIEIDTLFNNHREVLIIIVDPEIDPRSGSESNLGVYSKLANKNGILGPYLAQVLKNLLHGSKSKSGGGIKGKTSTYP